MYDPDREAVQESGESEMNTRNVDWEPIRSFEPGAPLSRTEEDDVVRASALVDANDDGVEFAGGLSVSAYRSLAKSRGVPLEHVVRAACRGQLADVVKRPLSTPTTTERTTPDHV